jgi:hypothetical protein
MLTQTHGGGDRVTVSFRRERSRIDSAVIDCVGLSTLHVLNVRLRSSAQIPGTRHQVGCRRPDGARGDETYHHGEGSRTADER